MHDTHLRRAWRVCRWGIAQTRANYPGHQRVLAWLARFREASPPLLDEWTRIVEGQADQRVRQLCDTADYFALSPEDRSWWRGMVQSHPFAALLHGVDNRTRRAIRTSLFKDSHDA